MAKIQNTAIVIFPYLFISKEFSIDDIVLRPSFRNIVDREEPAIKKQLLLIATFFRYRHNKQINAWSYYVTPLRDKKAWLILKDKLNKLTTILRYSKLSDPHNNALFSHFDYFVFEINRHLDNASEFSYYEGLINAENSVGFHIHKDLVENPFSFNYEISPLILEDLENDKYLQSFYSASNFNKREEKRLLRAMEWFNRSLAINYEVDMSDAIIHMEAGVNPFFS